ncbi:MAG TPA: LysR family transcriptional regulator [Coleofasciculaceae cyanobacterium]
MSEPQQNQIKPSCLRAFVAVVDCGNFGEAASALGVSQATLSYAIATLEEELGVILLARSRTGVTLTPVGEALIDASRQALRSLSGIVEIAGSYRSLQRGRVRVGVFRDVGTSILLAAAAQFQARFPQIAVSITDYADSETVKQALIDYKIDIGFIDSLTDLDNSGEFRTSCQLSVPLAHCIGAATLAAAPHPPAVFTFLDILCEMPQL